MAAPSHSSIRARQSTLPTVSYGKLLNVPNFLTLCRLASIPLFLTFLTRQRYEHVDCRYLAEGPELAQNLTSPLGARALGEALVEQIFNFPTMTEAYRIAAFDVMKQRTAISTAPPALARAAG